ncbi:MAG: MotA/TolQ/ExbB proton channel family protein [Magnetococcales bacterium]|nr:MotA/TolQ/ExbB proton channel family protein [Magnetococcales bacterium]
MDLATIIGLVLGFALIIMAIMLGGDIGMFINIPSLLMVVGGTIAAMFVKHKMSEVFGSVGVMMKAFLVKVEEPEQIIGQLTDMANIARKDGILALEKVKSEDAFLQNAINHCVDGADPDFLEAVLNKDLEYLAQRHDKGIALWEGIGETAPAFGMIGTLVGLVQMLASMEDPSSIGPAMAVALLTTLYGSIVANLIAIPIAIKLGSYSKEEQLTRQVVIDGMIGIQKGVNPRMLQESLKAALPPSLREMAE